MPFKKFRFIQRIQLNNSISPKSKNFQLNRNYRKKRRKSLFKMKIICIGDSLTFGNVGYSYIHFLNLNRNPHYEYINKGKNGDIVRGCYDRLKKIVDKSQYNSKIYVLGIGTNDIFLNP